MSAKTDQSSQSSFNTSTFMAEILNQVGFELVIFAATIAIALALRMAPSFTAKTKTPPSACAIGLTPSGTKSVSARRPSGGNDIAGDGRSNQASGSKSVNAAQRSSRQAPSKIDEIITCVTKQPPKKVLALYGTLRSDPSNLAVELGSQSQRGLSDLFSALVQCAGRAGLPDVMAEVLDDLETAKLSDPKPVYESAMRLLAGKKLFKEALAVFDRYARLGLEPSPVTLSCLISFAAEVDDGDRALTFYRQLTQKDVPSIRAYMTVLRVLGKRRDWQTTQDVVRDMAEKGVELDNFALNIALATGVAADQMDAVEQLLAEGAAKSAVDLVSFNTVLKGYSQRNSSDKAEFLLKQMNARGIKPNLITLNTAMDAAFRSGRAEYGWQLYDELQARGLKPDKCSCSTLAKGLQQGATPWQLTAILDLLETVAASCSSELRGTLSTSVLEAIGRARNIALLSRAFAVVRAIGVQPSSAEIRVPLLSLIESGDCQGCIAVWGQLLVGAAHCPEDMRRLICVFPALSEALLKCGQPGAELAVAAFCALVQNAGTQLTEECRATLIARLRNAGFHNEACILSGPY